MEVVNLHKMLLAVMLVLQIVKCYTTSLCPKTCICTPQGFVYCHGQRNSQTLMPSIVTPSNYAQKRLGNNKHLSQNELRTAFKAVLQQMPTAEIIDISKSKLHCDCQIFWLQKWILDENHQINKNLRDIDYICTSPATLKGKRVKDIKYADLNCPSQTLERQRRKAGRRKPPTYTSKPVDYCAVNHCDNNGSCILSESSSICLCPLSYTGNTCETRSEPQLKVYPKQLLDKRVQVNWTLDRQPLNINFNLEMKTIGGNRLIQSLMLPSEMRQIIVDGPFLTTRVRVCIYIYENNVITNYLACRNIDIDERGSGLPPPSDLPDDKIYDPYDASNFNEVIDKASIALGSIIGLCGLLILGLAIAYKNRQIDSDNNANMAADMNGFAYPSNTIIQLQTIRESYEEQGQEATLADASYVPIVETTGESLNMNINNAS